MIDLSTLGTLGMTEIVRLQNQLQHELGRRFERSLLMAFSDIVGSTPYFVRFGDAVGRQLHQLHFDLFGQAATEAQGGASSHFELRRAPEGLRLRTLSDGVTTIDGKPVDKGVDVPVRSGTRIGVANTLTLRLAGPAYAIADDDEHRTMMINPVALG